MQVSIPSLLVIATCVALTGCERKTVVIEVPPATPPVAPEAQTKTLETERLGAAVDAYLRKPDADREGAVKKALAALDGEIAELDQIVATRSGDERAEATAKRSNLQAYRTAELARFTAAQTKATVVPGDARTGAEKVEDTARKVGDSVENAARRAEDAVKDAVR